MNPPLSFFDPARFLLVRAVALIAALAGLLGWGSPASAEGEAERAEDTTITNLDQLWNLNPAVGGWELPLRVRAAVHYCDPEWRSIFLEIGNRVAHFDGPSAGALPFKAGQVVELEGFVRADRRSIIWERTKVTVLPDAVFPTPTLITRESSDFDLEQRLIEIEGLIGGQQEVDTTHLRFDLIARETSLRVILHLHPDEPVPQLCGAYVRLRGVGTVKRDAAGQIAEIAVWVAESGHLKITGWLSADAQFERPRTAVEKLASSPERELVRVVGTVHSQEPGKSVTLRDATGQVKLLTLQTQPMKVGDRIEAIGLPATAGLEAVLRDGLFRPLGVTEDGTTPDPSPGLPKLRLTRQIRELHPAEAALSYPVQLGGVVTWADPATRSFFLQDPSGGVQVVLPTANTMAMPRYEQVIDLTGKTRPGEFAPVVECAHFHGGGSRVFPEPREVTFEQAMTGGEYARWIELRGYVRAVTIEGTLARLDFTTSGGEFMALVPSTGLPAGLEGAVVQVRGVCGAQANERRQMVGLRVLVPSLQNIQVLEPVPADPFATPRSTIGSLRQFRVGTAPSRREQVSGVVLLHRPGQFLYLQDGLDRLFVLSRQTGILLPGDRVDVVGFPGHEGGRLLLREAVFRRTANGPEPAVLRLPQSSAADTELDGKLVEITGVLLNVVPQGHETRLQIQAGPNVFAAEWSGPANVAGERPLEIGSTLAITGVYRVVLDEYRQPRGFILNLRSARDVTTLRRPSWWTAGRVLWGTAGLLTVALLAAAWGVSLVRKNRALHEAQSVLHKVNEALEGHVEKRTHELAAERDLLHTLLENSPDQIYFKDRASRFLRCSHALVERFHARDSAALIGKSDADFFTEAHACPAFADEQRIIHTGEPLIGKVEKEVWKEGGGLVTWALTTKGPLRDKTGTIIGTFGISKDITAIKEAEEKVETIHRQLLETSRRAGMAEVATSVLHNVGNVLNSVNVSCAVITEIVRKSRLGSVARAASLLQEHSDDLPGFLIRDSAGQKLPEFLSKLAQKLAAEQATVLSELGLLGQNIEHIKDIVAMQQSHGRVTGVTETVSVADLVEDSLRMNAGALIRHEVEIAREFAEVPAITVEKHKVLQILVNLIRNAKHACDARGRGEKRMTVRVEPAAAGVRIVVSDNGVGIPAENLTRIFSHGFTTKKEGHGFGLHSAVLGAQEMGGDLAVESPGLGLGATFTLELPLTPPTRS